MGEDIHSLTKRMAKSRWPRTAGSTGFLHSPPMQKRHGAPAKLSYQVSGSRRTLGGGPRLDTLRVVGCTSPRAPGISAAHAHAGRDRPSRHRGEGHCQREVVLQGTDFGPADDRGQCERRFQHGEWSPMHERGPPPNGMNCHRSWPREFSTLNRSGSKVSASSHRAGSRCIP